MNTPLLWRVPLVLLMILFTQLSLAAVKEIRLPTAEDGEVAYQFDTDTRKPLSAKDDRSEVMTLALTFLPKEAGGASSLGVVVRDQI